VLIPALALALALTADSGRSEYDWAKRARAHLEEVEDVFSAVRRSLFSIIHDWDHVRGYVVPAKDLPKIEDARRALAEAKTIVSDLYRQLGEDIRSGDLEEDNTRARLVYIFLGSLHSEIALADSAAAKATAGSRASEVEARLQSSTEYIKKALLTLAHEPRSHNGSWDCTAVIATGSPGDWDIESYEKTDTRIVIWSDEDTIEALKTRTQLDIPADAVWDDDGEQVWVYDNTRKPLYVFSVKES
jgi:hypothetical protein